MVNLNSVPERTWMQVIQACGEQWVHRSACGRYLLRRQRVYTPGHDYQIHIRPLLGGGSMGMRNCYLRANEDNSWEITVCDDLRHGRLVTIYKELSEKREAEIAKNVATCIKTADVLAEEARAKAEAEAAKKAEEEAKRAKKAAKVAKPEAEPKAAKKSPKENVNTDKKARRGDAQERLDKYTAELKEKEAIAEPSKEVKHRIASLKRKIARAEKALGNVTVTNE